ncbi:MAG: serine hydrolase [Bacteroidia bacterium]|nr:serine hydrolase [Bacteroidia bacterium]
MSIILLGNSVLSQIDSSRLAIQLDSLVKVGLDSAAYPGAQVVVMMDGEVIFKKSYGYHTYANQTPVKDYDVYDLASVSKITTGLPILIKMHGESKFDPHNSISTYIPSFKNSNKGDISWKEVLSHQGGLVPWIAHWKKTLRKKSPHYKPRTFRPSKQKKYPIGITDQLFLHKRYRKKIFKSIKKSPLKEDNSYLYSGIMFYLMPDMIASVSGYDFETYLYEQIYKPIGASKLRFQPRNYFELENIVPTEHDSLFRKGLVHGFVHDEGAAMMNGISCNAGLFGNALDLAKLGNLYAHLGVAYGDTVLAPASMIFFTTAHYSEQGNRRALGFDKPLLQPDQEGWIGPCGPSASQSSFGHSGFTGTYLWIDPKYKLVFVFLSNRLHPTRKNRKLYSLGLRQLMHEACYSNISN